MHVPQVGRLCCRDNWQLCRTWSCRNWSIPWSARACHRGRAYARVGFPSSRAASGKLQATVDVMSRKRPAPPPEGKAGPNYERLNATYERLCSSITKEYVKLHSYM